MKTDRELLELAAKNYAKAAESLMRVGLLVDDEELAGQALLKAGEACEKAGLSYSKGWKIIKIAEDQLKYQIVDRKQGGKQGGGCTITEKGKELLNRYLDAEKKIKKYADEVFEEVFIAMVE